MENAPNFSVKEFVPPDIYEMYGEKSLWFIDHRIPSLCQFIRDRFKVPIYINTWCFNNQPYGEVFTQSGFRPHYISTGATFSQHKFGRAVDIKMPGVNYEDIRNDIRFNFKEYNKLGLSTIEKGTKTWLHIDVRDTRSNELYEVDYK